MGLNGFVWISKHVKEAEQVGEEGFDAQAIYSNKNDVRPATPIQLVPAHADSQDIDEATRRAIIVLSAVVQALGKGFIPITDIVLIQGYEWAVDHVADTGGTLKVLFTEDCSNRLAWAAESWVEL